MRRSKVLRATAWGLVGAGVAAPLLRKRLPLAPVVSQAIAFAAPLGLSVAARRTRRRDVAVCGLQMWAYVAAYKSPHADPGVQEHRTHFAYPAVADRALGFGELPTIRLQRAFARIGPDGPQWRALDRTLVWAHWAWFMVPHGTVAYMLLRHPERFPRAALMTYAVFDIGASVYWLAPTAPPWYPESGEPADHGAAVEVGDVRRMMVEYGEHFWRDGWGPLYSVLGGNPLAAMPSLHFATSLMAALLLAEAHPLAGALGFSYAITLGFALVYLGEHYVVDLLAGAALTGAVRRAAPRLEPLSVCIGRAVGTLESIAHERG